jgi:hypothetical protein
MFLAAGLYAAYAAATQFTDGFVWIIDGSGGTTSRDGDLYVGRDAPNSTFGGGVLYRVGSPDYTQLFISNANNVPDPYITLQDDRVVYVKGKTSFDERIRVRRSAQTAGIWYAEQTGTEYQFVGVKVHSGTGADQEFGIWQANAWKYWFRGNDNAYKYGSSSWTVVSDKRVKRKIRPFEEGLAVVEQLQPVWYQYNGEVGSPDDTVDRVGLVADQVETVVPYAVTTVTTDSNEDGEKLKTIDTGAFTYALINAVKELADENRRQQKELDALKRVVLSRGWQ